MRRNLARLLSGEALEDAVGQFRLDWDGLRVVELDMAVCEAAAEVAERNRGTKPGRTASGVRRHVS